MLQEIALRNFRQFKSEIEDYQFAEKQKFKVKKYFVINVILGISEFEFEEFEEAEQLIKGLSEGVLNMICSEPGLIKYFKEFVDRYYELYYEE